MEMRGACGEKSKVGMTEHKSSKTVSLSRRALFMGRAAALASSPVFESKSEIGPEIGPVELRIGTGCLSMNGVMCRVCGDRCDERAIRFQLAVGGIAHPIIDQSSCTGCGACVEPCPVGVVEIAQIEGPVQVEELS